MEPASMDSTKLCAAARRPLRIIGGRLRVLDATAIRFLITGLGAAALLFLLCYGSLRAGLNPFAGTLGAYAVCFVTAYLVQRAWTFRGAHRHRDALPRYLAAQVSCALLSAGVAHLLSAAAGLPPLPTSALVALMSGAVSYGLSRFWVFAPHRARRRLPPERGAERAGQAPGLCL